MIKKAVDFIMFWLKAARVHSLPMAFMSWLVVFCWAAVDGGNILLGVIALTGILLAQLGVNIGDDYMDFKREVETVKNSLDKTEIKMQKGKCFYLIEGKTDINHVLIATIVYFALASLTGLILTIICGWQTAAIAGVAAIFCLFYPKLTYLGLGEIAVAMTFAPLLFLGTYFVMTGTYSIDVLLVSISTGLLTVGLLHVHAMMDFDLDIKEDKKTLCTILGSKHKSLIALGLMMLFAYLNIFVLVLTKILSPYFLICFLTLPLAIKLYQLMDLQIKHPEIVPDKKFWMEPIEHWEDIQAQKAQGFMIRFYLSRNLMMYFSILICIAKFIVK